MKRLLFAIALLASSGLCFSQPGNPPPGTGGGAVASVSGDGTIYNNAASTGAVTLTLANPPTGTGPVMLAANPTLTGNNAASLASLMDTAALFTGGTGTTNFPYWFIQPFTATAVTTWNNTGTFLGMNAAAGFSGAWMDFRVNGGPANIQATTAGFYVGTNSSYVEGAVAQFGGTTPSMLRVYNAGLITWSSTTSYNGTQDIGFDRAAANVVEVNRGTAAGSTGSIKAAGFISGGTTFTATGCTTISATVGGATAGKFTIGASGCTVVITMNGATGLTAPNGYSCHANDETTAAGNTGLYFSANTTTTATLTVPAGAAANDVIDFGCNAF